MKRFLSLFAAFGLLVAVAACSFDYPDLNVGGGADSANDAPASAE